MSVLERLRSAQGNYVPLRELGSSLEEVHDALDALAKFGFGIERHPYQGAAYAGPAERLCPDQIEYHLNTRWVGRRVAVWNRVTSTNDVAARAGASLSNDGLVVLAEEQTAGRGRRGRSWTSPACSSILMSVVLFPPVHLAPPAREPAFGCAWLTALGSVAAAEVVAAATGRAARIKWPNDVRVNGRKIAGILVERALAPASSGRDVHSAADPDLSRRGVVVGIGLNVNLAQTDLPPELEQSTTSLGMECGGPLDRSELVRDLIRRLDHWYDAGRSGGASTLTTPWRALSEHLGTLIRVVTPTTSIAGRLIDLDFGAGLTLFVEPALAVPSQSPRRVQIPLADVLELQPAQ